MTVMGIQCLLAVNRGSREQSAGQRTRERRDRIAPHLNQGGDMITAENGSVSRPTAVDRITVALVAKAAEDLQRTVDRTGLSKTDIVNRALILYAYLDERMASGDELLVRAKDTGQTEIIKLL
jgi:hypothetical protein